MMSEWISTALRTLVRERSGDRCEYCLIHEEDATLRHQPDHVIAKKHGGETDGDNLANACALCYQKKGADIASIDDFTGEIALLSNPRKDYWRDHFLIAQGRIEGRTPVGRATVRLLQLNSPELVQQRKLLIAAGRFPPS